MAKVVAKFYSAKDLWISRISESLCFKVPSVLLRFVASTCVAMWNLAICFFPSHPGGIKNRVLT